MAAVIRDEIAAVLVPQKWPDGSNINVTVYRTTKTTGNGNCLFNACSLAIKGDESLSDILRERASQELVMNAERYCTTHPHIQDTAKKLHLDESGILLLYQVIIGNEDDTLNLNLSNLKESILNEGLRTKIDKRWSSMLQVMALSTVLNVPITSLYPDVDWCHRDLFHGTVIPATDAVSSTTTEITVKDEIIILWTRDGNLDNASHMFTSNHVVPMIRVKRRCESSSMSDANNARKKMKQMTMQNFMLSSTIDTSSARQTYNVESDASRTTSSPSDGNDVLSETPTLQESDALVDDVEEQEMYSPVEVPPSPLHPGDISDYAGATSLTTEERFHVLTFDWPVPKTCPIRMFGSKKRSFVPTWMGEFEGLVYSPKTDGAFCKYCVSFPCDTDFKRGGLVRAPYQNWKNAKEVFPGSLSRERATIVHCSTIQEAWWKGLRGTYE